MALPATDTTTYGVEGEAKEPTGPEVLLRYAQMGDISEELDQEVIDKLGMDCSRGYDTDKASIADWLNELEETRKLANQETEGQKTYPWPNASNVKYPLITQAGLEFNARAYPALINDGNIVKASITGPDPDKQKEQRKERITKYMSNQVMNEMPDWEVDMDRLLMAVPIDGVAFKKVYFDPVMQSNVAAFVGASELVVNINTKDLKTAPRISHVLAYYPYEIREKMGIGLWLEADLPLQDEDIQAPEVFIEQHILYDLDDDGYPEPYIVTFHERSSKVVRVTANYRQENIMIGRDGEVKKVEANQYFIKYECFPSPDGTFYGRGFGALLKHINDSVNSILNQMIDAGHLANTQGGFLGRGFNTKSGSMRFSPGEWKKVDITGGDLKNGILPLPVRDPSNTLFALLGMLIEAGKGIASIQDVMTGGGGKNMPATSVLAMIEQGSKVYTAIFKRLFRSLKEEFTLLYELNGLFLDEEEYKEFLDDPNASIADFEDEAMDIVPQADPRMATDMQRMAKAQMLREDMGLPWVNGPEVTKEVWTVAGIQDAEKYIQPPPTKPSPEQLEKLAEIDIKKKDAETKRITAVANAIETLAKAGVTGENNILNMLEMQIVKDELENADNERRPVPRLEDQQ